MGADLGEAKARLRRELRGALRALPAERVRSAARRSTEALLASPVLGRAGRVALYAALPDELPTRPLFQALAARGVECLLPRIEGLELQFLPLARWELLEPGPFGVVQPPANAPAAELGDGDLVIVPGLAFDRSGWRLGRGRGYYDRALAAAPGILAVGWAHAFQIVDAVPHDSHDRPVDAIVTENGWLGAAKR